MENSIASKLHHKNKPDTQHLWRARVCDDALEKWPLVITGPSLLSRPDTDVRRTIISIR